MTCNNPEHAALENELNDALEETLLMEERLAAYEVAGADTGTARGSHGAKPLEEVTALTDQIATLEKERDAYEQDYLNKKDRINELETQLEDKDQQAKDLDRFRRKLEEDLENTRKLLQTEKIKAADAQKRAGGADRKRRTEQRDQIKVLQELQELREQAEDLTAQVKERDALVEELALSNQAQLERNETLTVQNEDLRGEFNEVSQLLEEKTRELSDCRDQLEVAREAEEEYERRLDEEQAQNKKKIQVLENEFHEERTLLVQLTEDAERARDRAGAGGARERELELLRREVERLGKEQLVQSTIAKQAGLDLEVVTTELEMERRKNRDFPDEIRSAEAHKAEAMEAKAKELTAELATERQRYKELEDWKGKLEVDLQESEDWKRQYEEGHGLVDAVRFQKKLKNDIRRLEAELERRSLKIGEVMDTNEILTLTCQRLKEEAGRPHDFTYEDLRAFRKVRRGEGEDETRFARGIGESAPGGGASPVSSAGSTPKSTAGSEFAPIDADEDDAAGRKLAAPSEVALSDDEIVRLTRENHSLKEALRVMALETESKRYSHGKTSGVSDSGGGDERRSSAADGDGKREDHHAGNTLDGGGAGQPSTSARVETRKGKEASEAKECAAAAAAASAEMQKTLTCVNEAVMRQLKEIVARRGSPRETARRARRIPSEAGSSVGVGGLGPGGQRRGEERDKSASVQTDMQRLIAEMGDLRQLFQEGGFTKNTTNGNLRARYHSPQDSNKRMWVSGRGEDSTGQCPAQDGKMDDASSGAQSWDREREVKGVIPAPATGSDGPLLGQEQEEQQQRRTPQTVQGREALRWHLRRLNLPPEEWADDVRDLNAQLVEALEQLRARELELDEHEELIARYEKHLSEMRAQTATLYRDYAERQKQWDERQRASKEKGDALREERDALAVKANRLEEVLDVEEQAIDDPAATHRALRELSRKVTVYEVNETVMARRYASIKEQLQMESEARAAAERDFVEMSAAGKTRLLYLEQWKAGASTRLFRLQQRLDVSVPEENLVCARRELEQLQREFLSLLESSAESRVQVAKLSGLSGRISELEKDFAAAMTNLAASEEALKQANIRAEKADALVQTAVCEASAQVAVAAGGVAQADFKNLLAEVAKHQGECAKAEVERASATRRAEMAEIRLASLEEGCREVKEREASLEDREIKARQEARKAAAELVKVQNRFEGGLTGEQGCALKEKLEQESLRAETLELETERYKELADIASEQTLAMDHHRKDAEEELCELRKCVSDLESRSDDDRLIGQLQRKLTSTKVAYRSFARKHELTRANLRRKTALLRVLESRLDKREDALHDLHEKSQEKVEALKGALAALSEGRSGVASEAGPDASGGPEHRLTIARGRKLAARVAELSTALEASEASLRAAEQLRRSAEMDAEAAEEARQGLETLVADLKGLVFSRPNHGDEGGLSTCASDDQPSKSALDASREGGKGSGIEGVGGRTNNSCGVSSGSLLPSSSLFVDSMEMNRPSSGMAVARDNAARRILSLSEELRFAKLEASGLRRQVAGMKEDRRHLERKLVVAEAAARALEEAKAEAETRALLSGHVDGDNSDGGVKGKERLDVEAGGGGVDESSSEAGIATGRRRGDGASGLSVEEQRLLVVAAVPAEVDFGGLDPEEALRRLQGAHAKATSLTTDLKKVKAERDEALSKVEEASRCSWDLQRALSFYEKQATQNGLSLLEESSALPGGSAGDTDAVAVGGRASDDGRNRVVPRGRLSAEIERDRAGMQEAASTTVASMKRLLAEKNAALERMERKLEEARAAGRGSVRADRTEAARLTDRIYRDNEDSLGQLRVALRQLGTAGGLTGEGTAMNSRLISQLEEVSGLLGDKDETIRQLELKLLTASNQRERAEQRCGQALEENERMRSDLMTLASQVQHAEERALAALEDKAGAKRLEELRKALLSKDKKMRVLREALVKLKQEFVQAEVDREAVAAATERERTRKAQERSQGVDDRLKKLNDQLLTLREGMAQAARDLEKERRGRESATTAKEKLLEDNANLRAKMTEMEEEIDRLEGCLTETRRDLDAAREKEERLRSRIKTLSTGLGGSGSGGGSGSRGRSEPRRGESKFSDSDDESTECPSGGDERGNDAGGGGGAKRRRVNELEQRVQVLMAQNAALRSIVPPSAPVKRASTPATNMIGEGRRLGTAAEAKAAARSRGKDPAGAASSGPRAVTPSGVGNAGEGRRQAANQSSLDQKKLLRLLPHRRVEALERRLEEKGVELRAAEAQTAKARDLLARATKDKEDALRKLKEAGRRHELRASADEEEDMQSRLFSLEEENASLRRVTEIELPCEIDFLKHQVRGLRAQLEETDDQLEEAERRAKAAIAQASSDENGGGILRVEEDLFHELQGAREELSSQKAARRDLEGQVLERDAANIELRFDLEARAAEAERLRRRNSELQTAARKHSGSRTGGGANANDATLRPAGGRFKRERELEGVVDALRRVTEKLRGENERLRRSVGDGRGRVGAEKSAREAKKRVATLQEEVESLSARVKDADGAVLKLAQKQDLINQLRRRLKSREENVRDIEQRAEDLAKSKALLSTELEAANQRLIASDRESQSKPPTASSSQEIAAARTESEMLREQVQHQAEIIDRLRQNEGNTDGDCDSDGSPRRRKEAGSAAALEEAMEAAEAAAEAAQDEADQLRRRLAESERELKRMERRLSGRAEEARVPGHGRGDALSASGGGASAAVDSRLEEENQRLKEENEKLSTELQAFDLEFFEEIEDLKYKYSEAARKLRHYEQASSRQ